MRKLPRNLFDRLFQDPAPIDPQSSHRAFPEVSVDLSGCSRDDYISENKITSDLLRGHIETMILRLLCEADRYGYEIVKLIAERSGGEYELEEATMYSSVRRLEVMRFS